MNAVFQDWSCAVPTRPQLHLDLLAWSDLLDDASLQKILLSNVTTVLKKVHIFMFGGPHLSQIGILRIINMGGMKFQTLVKVVVADCPGMSDENIIALGASLPSTLRSISLHRLEDISDVGFRMVIQQHATHIERWSFRSNPRMTSLSLKTLADKCTRRQLELLEVEECGYTEEEKGKKKEERDSSSSSVISVISLCDGMGFLLNRIKVVELKFLRSKTIPSSVVFDQRTKMSSTESIHLDGTTISLLNVSRLFQARKEVVPTVVSPSREHVMETTTATATAILSQPNLQRLSLAGCPVGDNDLRPLHENITNTTSEHRRPTRSLVCSSLMTLNLSCTLVTDAGLSRILQKTGALRQLNVSGCSGLMSTSCLILAIASNPWLRSLRAGRGTRAYVDEAFGRALSKAECRHVMTCLHLQGIQRNSLVTMKGRSAAARLAASNKGGATSSPVLASALSHLPYLSDFTMHECENLTDDVVMSIASSCSSLVIFSLKKGCHRLRNEKALSTVLSLPSLSTFEIGDLTRVTRFTPAPAPQSLTRVSVRGCLMLTNDGLLDIVGCSSTLEALDCSMTLVDDHGLLALLKRCRRLHTLHARKAQEIQFQRLNQNLKKLYPPLRLTSLTNVDLSGCRKSSRVWLSTHLIRSNVIPLGCVGSASNLLYGHGLGRHGIYPHSLLTEKNIRARSKYTCEIDKRDCCIVFVQKVTRGFIAKRYVWRMKRTRLSALCRLIGSRSAYLFAMNLRTKTKRQERKKKCARKIIESVYFGVTRRYMERWSGFAESERYRHSSTVMQKYFRRHLERERVRAYKRALDRQTYLHHLFRVKFVERYYQLRQSRLGKTFRTMRRIATTRIYELEKAGQVHGMRRWKAYTLRHRQVEAATRVQLLIQNCLHRRRAMKIVAVKRDERRAFKRSEMHRKFNVIFVRRTHGLIHRIMVGWSERHTQLTKLRRSLLGWLSFATEKKRARYELRLRSIIILQRYFMMFYLRREKRRARLRCSVCIQRRWRGVCGRRRVVKIQTRRQLVQRVARATWFDMRRQLVTQISGRKEELKKRDERKIQCATSIQKAYQLWLGRRMWSAVRAYIEHRAANVIQSTALRWSARRLFTGKKLRAHTATVQILHAWKRYRRRQMWRGILSCVTSRRRERELEKKKKLLKQSKHAAKAREEKRRLDAVANILQVRLSYFWTMKKNWRQLKMEKEREEREEEEKREALREMAEGKRKYGTDKVMKEEWQEELESMQVEKRIPNLQQHNNQRQFGIFHRTYEWMKYKAAHIGTTRETKRKRGLPDLVPMRDMNHLSMSDRQQKKERQQTKSFKLSEHAKSSVKRFQRGAVPVLGIVDITFTVGDSEFLLMEQEQKINEKGGRRYFQPTERDLSRSYKRGSDGTRMPAQRCIMWICKESKRAQELLCEILIVPLEPGSHAGTSYAIHDDAEMESKDGSVASSSAVEKKKKVAPKGVQIVRHKRLPFEVWLKKHGVTPIVDIICAGRIENKNKWHPHNFGMLKKTGFVCVEQRLDNLPAMQDKIVSRQRDFIMVDREMMLWTKSVDTKADPKFEMKTISEQLR